MDVDSLSAGLAPLTLTAGSGQGATQNQQAAQDIHSAQNLPAGADQARPSRPDPAAGPNNPPFNALSVTQDNPPPAYKGNSRQELAQWYKDAKEFYDRRVRICNPVTWRSLISPEKLQYIAAWGLDNPLDVSLLTDHIISTWIGRELAVEPKQAHRIQAVLCGLKMRWTAGVPLDGVEELVQEFENMLHNHGLNSLRDCEEGTIKLLKYLLKAVRPAALREMLQSEIENDPEIGKNLNRFHRKLKEFAIMFDRVATCQKQVHTKWAETGPFSTQGREKVQSKPEKKAAESGKKRKRSDRIDEEKGKSISCFHCHKIGHPKRLCPELKTAYNKKQKKASDYSVVCALNLDSNRTVLVQIGSEYRVPAILDSGANQVSLIPRQMVSRILGLESHRVKLEKLDQPILIKLGDNQSTVEVCETLTLDITIYTPNGQKPIKNRRFLIWDIPSDEVILGSDILQSLGIDPYIALNQLTSKAVQSNNPQVTGSQFLSSSEMDIIKSSVDKAIARASQAGLDDIWEKRLRNLLYKYINTFRVKMGADSPASVRPFITKLKPDAKPYKCKPRRYSNEQSQFLKDFTDDLVDKGLIYENLNSEWASPVLVVKKEGGGHRMCVDLRAVNAMSESTLWPMPFLESIVTHLGNSKFWFKLDAFKGFWLMPLAEECQEMFSFMTDRAVFTPRRSIQGALNSAIQFQSRMHQVFKELIFEELIIWIDDLLGHAPNLQKWFAILERVLELSTQYNIKFNIEKCEFFSTEVKYCGRIFSINGVSHDAARVNALVDIPQPKTARDLQQFLMASQWMSRSIPEFNSKVYLLQCIFEEAMKSQPSRTKSIARQVRLSKFGWNPTHALAFEKLKQSIANHVKLAYPRKDMVQCLYTDANEYNSSAVVTQISIEDVGKALFQQKHEPLGFCGHKFSGSQLHWSIVEKEGFAVVDALHKLDYLLMNDRPFKLFVDHKNLLQIFSPTAVSRPVAQKLQRWALEIQKFHYEIHHVSGEENVWSDLMTRWGAAPPIQCAQVCTVRAISSQELGQIPSQYRVRPLQRKEFVWPSVEEIRDVQKEHLGQTLHRNSDNLAVSKSGKIKIPIEAKDLRIRLCIIAHAGGNSGHLGYQAALAKLGEYFVWPNMSRDMRDFCNNCLHCLPTKGGARIPRPLGEAIHGQFPNQVVHLDWLYIMPAGNNESHQFQWNLILRDDLSGYIRITPAAIPNSIVTVDALMEWRASSRTPEIIVTDMASYFMSAVMKEFTQRCNMRHHFTVAYGHYSNGSIEIINRNFLALIRALISELHWNKSDWPWLNKNIEHSMNHRPQARLGGKAPVTVFTGQRPDNPLDQLFGKVDESSLNFFKVPPEKILQELNQLQDSLALMHRRVKLTSKDHRAKRRAQSRIYRREPNFIIGDYVLVGDPDPEKRVGKKLFLRWKGPFRITDTLNGYIFQVENIIDSVKRIVHGDRIKYYADKQLEITAEIKDQYAYDNASYEIEQFRECRISPATQQIEFLVDWKGFTQAESSWEPLQTLWADVPNLVQKYHKELKQSGHTLADMVLEEIKKWTLH